MTELDFGVIQRALPFLLEGLALSFFLTVVAMLGGIVLGLGLAVIRLSRWKAASILAAGYVNGFRAIPLVLVIFWFYFLVPLALGRSVGALQSVIIAFVLFEAAYYSEIFRAGLQSIRPGQWQAAYEVERCAREQLDYCRRERCDRRDTCDQERDRPGRDAEGDQQREDR